MNPYRSRRPRPRTVAKAEPYPMGGTVPAVLLWVGGDKERAEEALRAEGERPQPRSTLVGSLKGLVGE